MHAPPRDPGPLSALDVIFSRRSIRAYTGERVPRETVRALLDAAVSAPTAVHLEPWAFVVVQDARILRQVSDIAKRIWQDSLDERALHFDHGSEGERFTEAMANPRFNVFHDAGTLVVICARPLGPFVEADCWLAAATFMIAAHAMGLGTCCIGSAVGALNRDDTRHVLGMPADVTAVVPIVVGVPAPDAPRASSRKAPDILAWH